MNSATSETPPPGSSAASSSEELGRLLKEIGEEQSSQGKMAHRLSQQRNWLSVIAGLGSGVAGAVVAAVSTLQGGLKTAVILIAFAGTAINAAVLGLHAPERAKGAQDRWLQLRSLHRRLQARLAVDGQAIAPDDAKQLIDVTLDTLDTIQGVQKSAVVRVDTAPDSKGAGSNDGPTGSNAGPSIEVTGGSVTVRAASVTVAGDGASGPAGPGRPNPEEK
ncbi:MAG TPA: hypothetical protein VIJ60_02135 [Acidimicrobiales bacterium]